IRALSTVMTLSNVSFENASVLVEEGKNATEQPTDSNGTDTAAEPGESTDTGCSKKSSCFGVVGGTDVVLLCGILFAFAVFAFDKKKDAVR
ncbi:MAG: hypothetical protein IJR61_05740, partial [Clostridia bacterium]|nr:hypothetical protein [Clostridia bacterium]